MSAHRTPPVTENDSPDGVKVDLATAATPATTCVIPGLQHGDRGGDCRRCKPLSWTSRPSPREREGSAFPLAWAHIKNRPTTTRPWKTTGHQGLPALPIGARVTPKILLTASRTSAKPDRTSAVLDSTQVARTFEATPHRGGSPQVRLASGGSHGHSDVMDAYFSALPTAATQAFSWLLCSNFPLGHFLRQPLARLFAPKRDGRISHCCSPARTGRCGFPPRDNRRDKHRMLTRHSDADDGAAAHAMDCT